MQYSYTHGKTLQRSSEIAKYQQMLNCIREVFHGQWKRLSADGVFGRGTRDAVKQFQIYANISATGVLDENTQATIQIKNRDAKRGYSYYKAPIANYQPANANYTVGIANPVGKTAVPKTDTSSIVDCEWKSLGADILDIIEQIYKRINASTVQDINNMQKFLKEEFERHKDKIQSLRKKADELRIRHQKMLDIANKTIREEVGRIGETSVVMEDVLADSAKQAGTNHVPNTKLERYNAAVETKQWIQQNYQKVRQTLIEEGNKSLKEIQNKEINTYKESGELFRKGQVAQKVAKKVNILSWGVNVGSAGYYIIMAVFFSDTEEERQQYLKKLKDTIATTVIDVGITVGTNVAVRLAAGSAAGPAGIIAVSIYTAVDLVFLFTTGESLSTSIWHFIQSIDWERAQVYYDYAYMGLNGRRSYGPKY